MNFNERSSSATSSFSVSSSLRPTWRRPRLDGGRHVGGAALGGHWKSHLLFFMFSQGGLNSFCVDVCNKRKNANFSLILGTQSRDAGSQRVKSSSSSGPPSNPCCQLPQRVCQEFIRLFSVSFFIIGQKEKNETDVWYFV